MWTEKGIIPSMGPGIGRGQEAAKMRKEGIASEARGKPGRQVLSKSDGGVY